MSVHSVFINNKSISKTQIDEQNIKTQRIGQSEYHTVHKNLSYSAQIIEADMDNKRIVVLLNGKKFECNIEDKLDHTIKELNLNTNKKIASKDLISTMPGLVLSLLVNEGDKVAEGDSLMILEAMKMENVLKANSDGVISKILCKQGDAVDKRQLLIEIA